jgi:hypothetical protein
MSQLFALSVSPLAAVNLSRRYGTSHVIRGFSALAIFVFMAYLIKDVFRKMATPTKAASLNENEYDCDD